MAQPLTLAELREVEREHELYYNHTELTRFCRLFYPRASQVIIGTQQEYDDEVYYTALNTHNLTAYDGRTALRAPTDEVELLVLLAESPELREALDGDQPDDSLTWFSEFYYDETSDLKLYRDPDNNSLIVTLGAPPPKPRAVYFMEADDAAFADA